MKDTIDENRFDNPVIQKWGGGAGAGFVSIPNILFKHQNKLDINNSELVVLLNILVHWWEEDQVPFPGIPAIAKRMGVSKRTVERNVKTLESKGIIKRIKLNEHGKKGFDVSGLVNLLRERGEIYSEAIPKLIERHRQYEEIYEKTKKSR